MDRTQSHCELIRTHLLDGRPITAIEALNFYNCMNLKGRIFNLRVKPYEMPIQREWVKLKNGKRIAKYYLLKSYIDRINNQKQPA